MAENDVSDQLIPLWIGGESVQSPQLKTIPVVSSKLNNKTIHYAVSADLEHAERACNSARAAFQSWKKSSPVERRDIFLQTADLLLQRKEELVKVQTEETGCSDHWANMNVLAAASNIKEIASRITGIAGVIAPTTKDYALAFREPIGVALSIPPWNAPLLLAARALGGPLGAGCTVVLKASELSPKTHHMLVQAFFDSGLPKTAVNIVQIHRDDASAVTEALIAHPAISKVEFIGSAPVGRIIGSLAGKHLKPALLELGGKNAAIVLEDADLDSAAAKCAMGAYNHHGQVCLATDRVYVVRQVAESFMTALTREAAKFPAGRAVSRRIAKGNIDKLLDAKKKGAVFVMGNPGFDDEESNAVTKTILTNVTPNMELYGEEFFGPSIAVYVVDSQEEALQRVNENAYGLVGAVHTRDMHRGIQIAREMGVGFAHVNGSTNWDESTVPFSATKNSGWGTVNAGKELEAFTFLKLVTVTM